MPTFIDLTNEVLRRMNGTEIPANAFLEARGVQAVAKDAVRNSIARINQREYEWPFNAAEATQVLVPGRTEYDWPENFKVVDWNSFIIVEDPDSGSDFTPLAPISRDEWYKSFRADDYKAGAKGLRKPGSVFPAHGGGFGLTASPDKAYTIKYRYFVGSTPLINPTDTPRIPDIYKHVIVDGAMPDMYLHRDNLETHQLMENRFKDALKDMQALLINTVEHITDTRVQSGAQSNFGF